MEYLTQRRTLLEPFSAKSGHFFLFSKKGRGDLPLPPLSRACEMRSNSPKMLILCLYTNLSLYSVVYDGKQKVGLHVIQHEQHKHHDHILKHTSLLKKWSFPLRISSVNMTKSTLTCGFGQTYRRNPYLKTSFFLCSACFISTYSPTQKVFEYILDYASIPHSQKPYQVHLASGTNDNYLQFNRICFFFFQY